MIMDAGLIFGEDQALTASAASTDYIDTKAAAVGSGDLWLIVRVGATALHSSSHTGTLVATLQCHEDSSFGSGVRTLLTSETYTPGAAGAAYYTVLKAKVPPGTERYLRVYYTVGTENFDAGTINAFLVRECDLDAAVAD